jgi:class 3 adenylate cyclase
MATTRRLAAILAADVAGDSRLMGTDEEGTHARFSAHRTELLDPKIEEHQGRIVKHTGDGLLAEFASVAARAQIPTPWITFCAAARLTTGPRQGKASRRRYTSMRMRCRSNRVPYWRRAFWQTH